MLKVSFGRLKSTCDTHIIHFYIIIDSIDSIKKHYHYKVDNNNSYNMCVYKYMVDKYLLCMIKVRVRWCTCSL